MLQYLTQGGPPPPPPAPVFTPGLNYVPALLVTVGLWAIVLAVIYYAQIKKADFAIRRVEALDAIEVAVGRAVETGRYVMVNASGVRPVGDVGISVFSIIHYIGRTCAKVNAKLQVFLQANEIEGGILLEDNLRQAYTLEGAQFNRNDVMRYEPPGAYENQLISIFYTEQPATYMYFGKAFPGFQRLPEELNRAGIMSVIGGNVGWHLSPFYDYAILGEEVIAAGSYLSGDPSLIATVVSSDAIQYVLMIFVVVVAVVELLGFDVISSLTDFWTAQR